MACATSSLSCDHKPCAAVLVASSPASMRSPPSLKAQAHGRVRRSCICEPDGSKHLEVAWQLRPSIHQVVDQGTVGFNAKQWLITEEGIRGTLDNDPCHRRHNDAINAINSSGLQWAKLEMQLLQGLSAAPYGGSAHMGCLVGAAEEFFNHREETWVLFLAWYPRISWEAHRGRLPSTYASAWHLDYMWTWASECWCFWKKGTKAKGGRWFQVFEHAQRFLPYFGCLGMVLEYVGIHESWIDDDCDVAPAAADSVHTSVPGSASVAPGAEGAPAEGPRVPVGRSNSHADALMKKCHNYKHVAFKIVTNRSLHAIWVLLDASVGSTRHRHNLAIKMFGTPRGCAEWLTEQVNSAYKEELPLIFQALSDDTVLTQAGLLSHCPDDEDHLHSIALATDISTTILEIVCWAGRRAAALAA